MKIEIELVPSVTFQGASDFCEHLERIYGQVGGKVKSASVVGPPTKHYDGDRTGEDKSPGKPDTGH